MKNYLAALLAAFACSFFLIGNAVALPSTYPKYRISNKEIHLKHGILHTHVGHKQNPDEDHVIYRYRWLGDDIVRTEADFEGEEDEEYPDRGRKVKLPGGCELTENQYFELETFKKETEYVKKCYCENGGVYCQINKALFKHRIA